MKSSIKGAMKRIASYEQLKKEILADEMQSCVVTYGEGEEISRPEYDFHAVRKAVRDIDDLIRGNRVAIHVANTTIIVPEFERTIGECLILMAQLNAEKAVLESLSGKSPRTRHSRSFSGVIEWTETNYDREECRKALRLITDEITVLQLALDRVNLTEIIEVPDDLG